MKAKLFLSCLAGIFFQFSFVNSSFCQQITLPNSSISFPKEVLPINGGKIDFYAKLTGYSGRIPVGGVAPTFFIIFDGTFSYFMGFNANDGAANGGLVGGVGNSIRTGTDFFARDFTYESILGAGKVDQWHHYVFKWNKNGIKGIDNGQQKVAIYIDGVLNSRHWTVVTGSPGTFGAFNSCPTFDLNALGNPGSTGGRVTMDEFKIFDLNEKLVLWNKLGSINEVQHSNVGLNGSFNGTGNPQFIPGISGNAIIADPVFAIGIANCPNACNVSPTADVLVQPSCTTQTGTIVITAPAGPGITYSIGGAYQASGTFTGIAPGTYNVTTKNSSGCISPAISLTVDAVPSAPAIPTAYLTQPTCTVATGTIDITDPIGANITYSIDGVTYQASSTFTGVGPGTYNVTAQNGNGCISGAMSVTINDSPIPATPTTNVTQPTCSVPTGTIVMTAPTGADITYSIGGAYQSGGTFTDIFPGTYDVTSQNSSGCISAAISVIVNAVPDVATCFCATSNSSICGLPSNVRVTGDRQGRAFLSCDSPKSPDNVNFVTKIEIIVADANFHTIHDIPFDNTRSIQAYVAVPFGIQVPPTVPFGLFHFYPNGLYHWKIRFKCTDGSWTSWVCGPDFNVPYLPLTRPAPIDTVKLNSVAKRTSELTLYPNPSSGSFTAKYTSIAEGKIQIIVYDPTGRRLLANLEESVKGDNLYKLDLMKFAAGNYFIEIINANERTRKRFVIQK